MNPDHRKDLTGSTAQSYLELLAILVINGHGHLHVFGRGLVPLIKVSLNQSHIDVISHITFREQKAAGQMLFILYYSITQYILGGYKVDFWQ